MHHAVKRAALLAALIGASLYGQADPMPPVYVLRLRFWRAAARANAAQIELRNRYTDEMKHLEEEREKWAAEARAARGEIEKACAAEGKSLDPAEIDCFGASEKAK